MRTISIFRSLLLITHGKNNSIFEIKNGQKTPKNCKIDMKIAVDF